MAIQPNSFRPGELPEFTFRGPWGGVISDVPASSVEQFAGFTFAQNIMFRKGQAVVRPALGGVIGLPVTEPILGVADFFDADGIRHQTVMTPTRLYEWNGGTQNWVEIPPVSSAFPLSGGANDHYSWTVVGEKLCFCQGVNKVQLWNGITATFGAASASAIPAKYLMELGFYLLAMNTIEGGSAAPQRVRWTAPGDPTDWTSLSAGQTDLFNALGPINGCFKLYQAGFILQQFGFTMIQLTGNGLAPFAFIPLVSTRGRGLAIPFSAASDGESVIAYVGKDNIYQFNGTESIPIGDMPVSGSRTRIGARYAIFGDLLAADFSQVFGFISTSIDGNPYNAYWLFIPIIGTWVYNFDEQNWTKFTWSDLQSCSAGIFFREHFIRIMDLIGTIADQNWTPASLVVTNPFDSMLVNFRTLGPETINFGGVSETQWVLAGQWQMGDFRHNKTLSKIRLVATDVGATEFFVVVQNEKGQSSTVTVAFGTGSGQSIEVVIPIPNKLNGMFFKWQITGFAGEPLAMSEFTPVYDVGGEYQN